jgi:hypothetical protein
MNSFSNKNVKIEVDDLNTFDVTLTKPLGCGGSKCAFAITTDLVLMVPNSRFNLPHNYNNWERITDEEYKISQILTDIGIYNPNHKKVKVYVEDKSFESYVSKNFDYLTALGINVIDMVKFNNGKIDYDYKIFYDENINLNDVNNWFPILSNLLNDIVLLYKYRIPLSHDSTNFVLIKNVDVNQISPYKIRYFGFDFTQRERSVQWGEPHFTESQNPIAEENIGVPRSWSFDSLYNMSHSEYTNILYLAIYFLIDIINKDGDYYENEKLAKSINSYFQEKLRNVYYTYAKDYPATITIHDLKFDDIEQFLELNMDISSFWNDIDKIYHTAFKLMMDENTIYKGVSKSIIEWMKAYNVYVDSKNNNLDIIPSYTITKLYSLSKEELNKLAKLLGMKNNKIEHIINILRYLRKIHY